MEEKCDQVEKKEENEEAEKGRSIQENFFHKIVLLRRACVFGSQGRGLRD